MLGLFSPEALGDMLWFSLGECGVPGKGWPSAGSEGAPGSSRVALCSWKPRAAPLGISMNLQGLAQQQLCYPLLHGPWHWCSFLLRKAFPPWPVALVPIHSQGKACHPLLPCPR